MIKTPLSTMIGGAFWTPGATILGSSSQNISQLIKSLFANNEQGFAYDPNDLTTLYQDAAGTIPVTAAGQPVGLMLDKSGRNNHASQTVSASRPILQRNATTGAYYLAFDGADDFLVTKSIDFTSTDKVSLFAGVRKLSDAATGIVAELSTRAGTTTNLGAFVLYAPFDPVQKGYGFRSVGTVEATTFGALPLAPNSSVLAAKSSISLDILSLRVNSTQYGVLAQDQGSGNYGNYPLYIGRRVGTPFLFNGHLYSLIGISRLTTDSETIALEKSIAKNVGVTLSV